MLRVDNSLLSTLSCDTHALLRHHHGLTAEGPEPAYFVAGRAAHGAHAVWLRGGMVEEAMARYRAGYYEYAHEHVLDPFDRLSYENTSTILRVWFEEHPLERLPFVIERPEHVEIAFQLPLLADNDELVLTGRIDAVARCRRTGRLGIVDHKHPKWCRSTPQRSWFDQWRYSSQMTGYTWAGQETLGEPIAGFWINAVEFSALPKELGRKCTKHGIKFGECRELHVYSEIREFSRTPSQLADWHRNAVALAQRFAELQQRFPGLEDLRGAAQQGMFYGSCSFCEFRDFCEANRPVQWAGGMLKHQPWSPLAEMEA